MKTIVDARQIYRDTAVRGATPIELVILLYDAAIEDMRRALTALQGNDIEMRANRISHALMVLQQLQGTLDFERGGSAARQFEQFYNVVRAKLLEAQMRSSHELMRQQIRYMSEVRDCWVAAKRLLQSPTISAATPAGVPSEEGGSQWSA
ncbi:MAG TPA: flagellar export chaperone FliS [Terriglobales bacterium]|nr:flagellar export chaperone FliS [Terriglobales bacterium]